MPWGEGRGEGVTLHPVQKGYRHPEPVPIVETAPYGKPGARASSGMGVVVDWVRFAISREDTISGFTVFGVRVLTRCFGLAPCELPRPAMAKSHWRIRPDSRLRLFSRSRRESPAQNQPGAARTCAAAGLAPALDRNVPDDLAQNDFQELRLSLREGTFHCAAMADDNSRPLPGCALCVCV